MIRVHLPAPAHDVVDLDANGWFVDTDRGFLTVSKDGRHIAAFAHNEWAYIVEDVETAGGAS